MEIEMLSTQERRYLLLLARQSIERVVCGESLPRLELNSLPPMLREAGVCFVTLTMPDGELRGCIGGLEAFEPLAEDVCRHAAAAALEDYRFAPVRPEEIPLMHIEISRLTAPHLLEYGRPEALPDLITPYKDGVVLRDGARQATFLPQVWEKMPDPCVFLSHLCEKMGLSSNYWRKHMLEVEIYHVEAFHEELP